MKFFSSILLSMFLLASVGAVHAQSAKSVATADKGEILKKYKHSKLKCKKDFIGHISQIDVMTAKELNPLGFKAKPGHSYLMITSKLDMDESTVLFTKPIAKSVNVEELRVELVGVPACVYGSH